VTDRIETFTEGGIRLASGEELQADIVITATGLNLLALGGIELAVDGEPVDLASTVGYKGMMLSGVPNMVLTLGYTNASWTLKADLVAEYVCRLLNHMSTYGYGQCTPVEPDAAMPRLPFLDLKSGRARAVAAAPELRRGPAHAAPRPCAGRGHRVHAAPAGRGRASRPRRRAPRGLSQSGRGTSRRRARRVRPAACPGHARRRRLLRAARDPSGAGPSPARCRRRG